MVHNCPCINQYKFDISLPIEYQKVFTVYLTVFQTHNGLFSNRQAASLPGCFKLDMLGFKCLRTLRINSKFRMHTNFTLKPNSSIIFNFSI